jgi:hypothetical protein
LTGDERLMERDIERFKNLTREGLEIIRLARNNMYKEEFEECIAELCVDGNLRYPLLLAGTVATEVHVQVVEESRKNPEP